MNKNRLCKAVALCLVVCLCLSMTACFGKETGNNGQTPGTNVTYTVEIKTEGGMALEKVTVYVYEDSSATDLVAVEKTDESGKVSFEAPASDSYVAVLQDVPEGYVLEESYPLTGELTQIVLKAQLVEGNLKDIQYTRGSVMQDFTMTAADGKSYKLSELLQTKKAVVLNFWYLNCQPCKAEFPYLQEAYAQYSDSIALLAMNPVDGDDKTIQDYATELGLTFPMGICEPEWEQAMQLSAYPTTVIIDRFGSIALIHKGSIPNAQIFADAFAFFTADDYVQTVVEDIEDLLTEELPTGTADNPTEIGGVTEFELTVEAGKVVYVDLYKVKNAWMQISNGDIYVEYDGKTHKASDGKVGLLVTTPDTYTPAKLGFGNSGSKAQTFTVYLSSLPGTMDNPYRMSLGEFGVSVSAGNDQGVFYRYVAAEDGVLKVQCLKATSGVDYDFSLYNLNSYAMRTASADAENDASGLRTVSVTVKKGQTVQFSAGSLPDSSNVYPAASFTFKAVFSAGKIEEKPKVETMTYAVTVTDPSRKPITNVQINLLVEGRSQAIKTNDKGIAGIALPAGTYPATVVLPLGYKASTTQFQLTEKNPTVSVKLEQIVVEKLNYTVKVTDENGAPLQNVLVAVGGVYGNTNANGVATFNLPKGAYTASVVAPDGYVAEADYAFAQGSRELTVQLNPGSGSGENDPNKQAYTVTVTDYQGKAVTGVLVQIFKSGKQVAMKTVDSQGAVTLYLDKGSYTVELAFQAGTELYYEQRSATLTSSVPELTIKVAGAAKGTYEEVEGSAAYHVSTGGTYVQLPNAVNYFLFTPEEAGMYEITTSDPDAQIEYWGNTFFPNNQTPDGGYENNIFTANVKPQYLGVEYLLAVSGGKSETILIITRVGEAELDESDLIPEPYTAKTTPKSFSYSGSGTLTYVSLNAKHKAVYNSADGYYHLDSASGPVLYMNLGPNAPYISMYNMLGFTGFGGTSFCQYAYNAEGKAVRKIDFVPCMSDYISAIDPKLGIYPLTEDLIYMMQQGGGQKGWWDSTSPNYLFAEISGMVADTGWMFSCCYFK